MSENHSRRNKVSRLALWVVSILSGRRSKCA